MNLTINIFGLLGVFSFVGFEAGLIPFEAALFGVVLFMAALIHNYKELGGRI